MPDTVAAAPAGDAVEESTGQRIYGVAKVSSSLKIRPGSIDNPVQQVFLVWAVTQLGNRYHSGIH